MRIGLLIFGDINTQSGGYLYDRQLVAYLRAQGDTVEILSLPQSSYIDNLRCGIIPAELVESELDILIQDELVYPRMFNINSKLKVRLSCPIVSLVHLLDSSRPQGLGRRYVARWAEHRYLRSVDGLILNSRHTRQLVCELLQGNIPPHVIAVPAADHQAPLSAETCGVEIGGGKAAEGRTDSKNPKLNILYVGNVIHQKGLHVLLEALGHMQRGHFRLTVAGRLDMEPAYVKRIYTTIRRKNLERMVRFAGSLNSNSLISCYQEHDVMVLPSVNEAYGIVYIEAQQFGLPIIGTFAGGAREIIQPGINGYLIEPGDSNALAGFLTLLHNNRAHLKMLGANALRYYRQHPRWDNSCALIRAFLLHSIAARSPLP